MDDKPAVADTQDLEAQQEGTARCTGLARHLSLQHIREGMHKHKYFVAIALLTFILANVIIFAIDCPSSASMSDWSPQPPQQAVDNQSDAGGGLSEPATHKQVPFDDYNPFGSPILIQPQVVGGVAWWRNWREVAKIVAGVVLAALIILFLCLIDYNYVWAVLQAAYVYLEDRLSSNEELLQRLFGWVKEKWDGVGQYIARFL